MFKDRIEAGKKLANKLKNLKEKYDLDPVIVALPRGGVVVGYEIAKELNCPLDILFVKKIPAPFNEELAIGSVSEQGIVFINKDLVEKFNINENYLQEKGIERIQEIARLRDSYKIDPVILEGKDVIIVDDGIATGATMYLASQSIARDMPRKVIIASPVVPNNEEILNMLKSVSHHIEILKKPDNFMSVGKWYEDFHELCDEEVKEYLNKSLKFRKND